MRSERLGRVAGVVLYPPDAVQALRHRRPERASSGLPGPGARAGLAAYTTPVPRRFAGRFLDVAHRDQARARLQLVVATGARLGGQRQAQLEPSPQGGQRLGLRADPGRQLANVVVCLPQCRANDGRPLRKQVSRRGRSSSRPQQLGSQTVELLLLEQQILADPAVKCLDRLQRKIEACRSRMLASSSSRLALPVRALATASSKLADLS